MMMGVAAAPRLGLSLLGDGLYTNTSCLKGEVVDGWLLPLSHSSIASPSPAVLLKLLVLEEEREMLARPFSFNFMKGFSLLGQISGELGLDEASDFIS